MKYFYDSFAVIEFFKGNERVENYFGEGLGVLTHFNLIEIHYAILREFTEQQADEFTKALVAFVVVPEVETILAASKFRVAHKKAGFSYTDCVGYLYALKHNMKFLTGDPAFREFPNVEFVV